MKKNTIPQSLTAAVKIIVLTVMGQIAIIQNAMGLTATLQTAQRYRCRTKPRLIMIPRAMEMAHTRSMILMGSRNKKKKMIGGVLKKNNRLNRIIKTMFQPFLYNSFKKESIPMVQ